MPEGLQPAELFIQLGFAGLFLYLFLDIRKESKERETSFRTREAQFIEAVKMAELKYQEIYDRSCEHEEEVARQLAMLGNMSTATENLKQTALALQATSELLKMLIGQSQRPNQHDVRRS